MSGPRVWRPGDAEPTGFVRALLLNTGEVTPFTGGMVVSFGEGMWFLLHRDGEIVGTTWETLLSVGDAVVEFEPGARCRHAWRPPAGAGWLGMPDGEPPYRCAWLEHEVGAHLVRGLMWVSEAEHEVVLDA